MALILRRAEQAVAVVLIEIKQNHIEPLIMDRLWLEGVTMADSIKGFFDS